MKENVVTDEMKKRKVIEYQRKNIREIKEDLSLTEGEENIREIKNKLDFEEEVLKRMIKLLQTKD